VASNGRGRCVDNCDLPDSAGALVGINGVALALTGPGLQHFNGLPEAYELIAINADAAAKLPTDSARIARAPSFSAPSWPEARTRSSSVSRRSRYHFGLGSTRFSTPYRSTCNQGNDDATECNNSCNGSGGMKYQPPIANRTPRCWSATWRLSGHMVIDRHVAYHGNHEDAGRKKSRSEHKGERTTLHKKQCT
jgi:hypothetical protein